MTPAEIRETLAEYDEDLLLADGFEEALIGIVDGACRRPVACYDYDLCVEILMRDMTRDEAEEYLEYNTLGSFAGEMTPLFLHDWRTR